MLKLAVLKAGLVRPGRRRRRVMSGVFRGLSLDLDLRHQTQLLLGLHEREVYRYLREFGPHLRSAVDVGAAEGEYALYFLTRTPAIRVIAVEPDATCRALMDANLAANAATGDGRFEVAPYFVGAGDADGEQTLDLLTAELPTPCLIKVDVDGGEKNVLDGAARLLQTPDVVWIVETHSIELERACAATFAAAGLRTHVVANAWWRAILPENRPIPHNRWLVARPR